MCTAQKSVPGRNASIRRPNRRVFDVCRTPWKKRRGGQPVRADDHSLEHFDCLVNPTRLGARFHRPEYLSGPQFAAGRTPTHHRVWHAPAYSSSPEATILVRLPRVATSAILRSAFSRTPCSMHTKRSKQRAPLALSYRSTSSTSRPCKGQRPLAVYCNRGRDRSELEAGLTRDPLQRQRLPSSRSIVSPPI